MPLSLSNALSLISFSEKGENEKTTWSLTGGVTLLFVFARYLN